MLLLCYTFRVPGWQQRYSANANVSIIHDRKLLEISVQCIRRVSNRIFIFSNTVYNSPSGDLYGVMRVSMKCHTPPPCVKGGGFVKIRVSKAPPLGQSKFEAGPQFALNDDSLGKFVLRNCCQQQTCVVCHHLGKL